MATSQSDSPNAPDQSAGTDWETIDHAVRSLQQQGTGHGLSSNLTDTPGRDWDWQHKDQAMVKVQETDDGRRRVVIEQLLDNYDGEGL